MASLIGEFNHTIDSKGRLSIPSKFRNVLGDTFVISKGVDDCLVIYSQEEWDAFQEKLRALPTLDDSARELRRFFGSGSAYVELDPHGRILVPSILQAYAGLSREVTIVGTMDGKAEIWDTAKWNERSGISSPKDAIKNLMARGITI